MRPVLAVESILLKGESIPLDKVRQRRSRITQGLNVRHRVRFASSLAAALLDGLFAHPAWLFNVVSNLNIRNGDRGQNEFFRSLLRLSTDCFLAE